jgi:hypothetical protein
MVATTHTPRPRRMNTPRRRRREKLPHTYSRPGPIWKVGHYDGPTAPVDRRDEARFLATGIVAPIYRGNPGACLTLLLKAQALDIPVATALDGLHWSPALGKGALSAQLMAGLLRRHGYHFKVTREDADAVHMTFYRVVDGRRRKLGDVTWTILEAVTAGLSWRELWQHYPADMLWARCLMRGARRYASEIGTGLAYTAEELHDMSAPAAGGEVADAVSSILQQATAPEATPELIKTVLVAEARKKKILEADVGDGQTLGYTLGMLWGEARARQVDELNRAAPALPAAPAGPAGSGSLACGCPASHTLRTGRHLEGCRG